MHFCVIIYLNFYIYLFLSNLGNLLDLNKGQEFLKALIQQFKENLNLKTHFSNFINPNCSCQKSFELAVSRV
jgi:hypothetical protein